MKRNAKKAELILKAKDDLKEGSDNKRQPSLDYDFFKLIGYHLDRGCCLKLNVKGQGSGRILDVDGQAV